MDLNSTLYDRQRSLRVLAPPVLIERTDVDVCDSPVLGDSDTGCR